MHQRHVSGALAMLLSLVVPPLAAQATPAAPNCREVPGWPRLPSGESLGVVSGVGVAPSGDVVLFRRAGRIWSSDTLDLSPIEPAAVLVLDSNSGTIRRSWGAGRFAMPHGLTVDRSGNVWLTDVAYHQVYKFSAAGQLLLTIGERGVAGDDATHLNQPSGVSVVEDGSFYVSDGYRNTRVLHFTATGRLLRTWGTPGAGPGQFNLVHGVALGAKGRVYVSDRENLRVQVFDSTGRFLVQWKSTRLGKPFAVATGPAGTRWAGAMLVADGGLAPYFESPSTPSGVAIVELDGRVRGRFAEPGRDALAPLRPHAVAVGQDGAVYVAGLRLAKFTCR